MVVRCGSWIISFNISSPMRAIALLLACLACAGHGSREKEDKQIQDGSHAERSTTPSSHSLAELEQSQSIARGAASKPMKLLTMLLLALKDPADAFAPHATMPGEREVRSNLQFPAAPNSNFHGGLGRRARPPGVGDPGEGEGFLPDAGLFDDEDPAIQESNVQLVERRRVLSSVLAAVSLLNAPKTAAAVTRPVVQSIKSTLGAPRVQSIKLQNLIDVLAKETLKVEAQLEAANQKDLVQVQALNELIAKLREAEDKVRDAKRQFSEKQSEIEALKLTADSRLWRLADNKKEKNEQNEARAIWRQLERELKLVLSEEARVQKKLKVQIEAPEITKANAGSREEASREEARKARILDATKAKKARKANKAPEITKSPS